MDPIPSMHGVSRHRYTLDGWFAPKGKGRTPPIFQRFVVSGRVRFSFRSMRHPGTKNLEVVLMLPAPPHPALSGISMYSLARVSYIWMTSTLGALTTVG